MRSCASGSAHSSRTAHIIQLQPEHRYRACPPPGRRAQLGEPGEGVGVSWRLRTRRSEGLRLEGVSCSCSSPLTEVNLSMSCSEPATGNHILILQSHTNLTWILSPTGCHVSFLVRRGRGGPQSLSPPRCGPDRGGCSHLDAPGPAKPPPCHPHRSPAPTGSRPCHGSSYLEGRCPTRSRAWSPKPSRRTAASSPPIPSSPPAPASPWRSRSAVGPRRPSWAQGFWVGGVPAQPPASSPRRGPEEAAPDAHVAGPHLGHAAQRPAPHAPALEVHG